MQPISTFLLCEERTDSIGQKYVEDQQERDKRIWDRQRNHMIVVEMPLRMSFFDLEEVMNVFTKE